MKTTPAILVEDKTLSEKLDKVIELLCIIESVLRARI